MEALQTQVVNAEKYYKIPDSVKKVLETKDYREITNTLETLQKIQYSGQPKLSFSMDDKDYKIKISHQVTLTIINSGEVHTRNVRVSFCDDVSIKRISPIPELKAGDSGKIMFAMVPNISGEIPLDLTIECEYGSNNKHYKIKGQKWIRVFEGTNEVQQVVSPDPKQAPIPPPINQQEELLRRYSDIEFKGQGSFAKVFKAKRKDGSYVAIKVPVTLDASTGKSFITEIQNWTKLDHENIVRIYDFNILPTPYFEMELCDLSLADNKLPMDCKKAALIIFGVCKGLEYAHSKKIIHRDLKPQNILLKSKIPKISDWGLSKVITKSASMTTTSYTPYYAAPEQINNKSKDERTDIWQLGVILYELTTGVLPFNGDTMTDVAMNIIMNPPKIPSEINPDTHGIEPIIMKCLEKNPEKRYKSAIELQNDLNEYLKDDLTESLKESSSAHDFNRSAQFCGELITISLVNGNIQDLYNYLTDLVNYAAGDTKKEAMELAAQLHLRIENNIFDIPDEFAMKAGNIVHKVKYGFKNI